MQRSLALFIPAALIAACTLSPGVENGAARVDPRTCSTGTLNYGSCVTGTASKASHGRHTALLRRGDQIKVTLQVTEGDLNPGLALKSPKYSIAVRHEAVVPPRNGNRTVEKTWTIKSTGFYSFVAFPWSNQGSGQYWMSLDCVGGPCLRAQTIDAEVAGACIGEARDQTIQIMQDERVSAYDVGRQFGNRLTAPGMPDVCGLACSGELKRGCDETIRRISDFVGRPGECFEQIGSCLADCVPFNTTSSPIVDLGMHPEMQCWASYDRPSCAAFGASLSACGNPSGLVQNTEAWCNGMCVTREGPQAMEACQHRCEPKPHDDDDDDTRDL